MLNVHRYFYWRLTSAGTGEHGNIARPAIILGPETTGKAVSLPDILLATLLLAVRILARGFLPPVLAHFGGHVVGYVRAFFAPNFDTQEKR